MAGLNVSVRLMGRGVYESPAFIGDSKLINSRDGGGVKFLDSCCSYFPVFVGKR